MNNRPINLLLFGDQTVEKLSGVWALARLAKTSNVASRFLQAAADAIQVEVRGLTAEEQADVDEFDTILGLAQANAAREEPNEMIATVLMAIVRLGELIVFADEDATLLGGVKDKHRTEVIGLCTGQLPAAVAVAARNTSELFELAVETTRIALRLAREICRNSRRIDATPGPWATTVLGLETGRVQQQLDAFHRATNVPPARRIAIGVEARGWITLFGAPSTQTRLWAWSSELRQAPRIPTEARGGVHMPNVPPVDTSWVLGTSPLLKTPLDPHRAVTYSTVDGRCLQDATTFGELLAAVLPDIVHHPLRFSETLDAVIKPLPAAGRPVRLVMAGPTSHATFVRRALDEQSIAVSLMEHEPAPALSPSPGLRGGSNAIAVVGMSGRFPGSGSSGVQGFWDTLDKGRRHITEIPKSRFDLDTYYDATGQKPGSTLARHGAFLDHPGLFDNRLFNVSPREALQMDPVHRLLLTASYEALESAGYSPDATPSTRSARIATFMGQASDDHREILANEGVDIYYIPGIVRAFASGRLNYHFKWGGGTYCVDSACATGTTAALLACRALLDRDCDMALAGAGSILNSPWPFAGLSRGGFLSLGPGGCNTYHDDADGYVRGEAIGVVVLKRLEDALADNDNILGVIDGAARNYSGDATSITHPSPSAQRRLAQDILQKSATDPASISYVEMHGTGTQAGDNVEMSSVLSVFGRGRTKKNPLTVGSVKANIGHGEAAAGTSSLIKVLMMFRERRIPPQPEFPFKINTKFPDLDALNVHISTKSAPLLPAADGKRRIFLNSFDASGGNTCMLLEEAPAKPRKPVDPRPCHIVTLSARTPASLFGNKQRLLDHLKQNPAVRLADVAYTTSARRMHHPLRSAFVVQSTAELLDLLSAHVREGATKVKSVSAKVMFSFTGQGALYAGMGKDLWEHSPSFRQELESFQAFADLQGLPKFTHLIAQGDVDVSTTSPAQGQLAIVALEIALAHLFQSMNIKPDVVIGHSLGEYAALCVAGVLSVSDTIYLVATRAAMMEEKLKRDEFAMLVVSKSELTMREHLDTGKWSSCEVACINAPNMTVVSGTMHDLNSLQEELKGSNVRTTLLPVAYGFHSKQLEPILDGFEQCAQGVTFSKPTIPIASTLLREVVTDSQLLSAGYLRRQAREPVSFTKALEACKNAGFIDDNTLFLEIGPEPICSGLIRETLSIPRDRTLASLKSGAENWATISAGLAALYTMGVPIKWHIYHKDFIKYLTLVDLPSYAFDEKEFWVPFVQKNVESAIAPPAAPAPVVAGFPTTSLQRFKCSGHDGKAFSVTFETDPYEQDLSEAIRGHAVAGVTICPSSVFCDMSLSAAKFAHAVMMPNAQCPPLTILDLSITHPLILSETPIQQTVEVIATVPDSEYPTTCRVAFKIHNENGVHDIGGCSVSYEGTAEAEKSLSRQLYFVRTRIESLQEKATRGFAHRLFKPVVYKLFENLVKYAPSFQGLEEVVLDSDMHDAVATVRLPVNSSRGKFMFKAHLLDAIVHIAGFLANCGLKYPHDIAFLSTAVEKWHFFQPFSEENTYTSYVHMEETQGGSLLVGDVYVFNGNTLACAALGVKSQKMKKSTMLALFGASSPGVPQSGRINVSTAKSNAPTFTPSHRTVSSTPLESNSEADKSSDRRTLTPTTSVCGDDDEGTPDVVAKLLAAVAAESGAERSEMTPETAFADLGVDSLMAIVILASVKNETGVELPGSFFLDYSTIGGATAALGGKSRNRSAGREKVMEKEEAYEGRIEDGAPQLPEQPEQPEQADAAPSAQIPNIQPSLATPGPQRRPKLILMQGSPSSTEAPVFFLADATGMVSSYAILPGLESGRRVYGIESPFAREGQDYECSVEAMAALYATAIRETHASGPYILAGFSTGAVHAFEVCRQLSCNVLSLILFNMAAPANPTPAQKNLGATATLSPERLQHAGVFMGESNIGHLGIGSEQLESRKRHVYATVKSLLAYCPTPLPDAARPKQGTVLITGSTGPVSNVACDNDDVADLLLWARGHWDDEADESMGWRELVGEKVERFRVEASYADLLQYPKIREVAKLYKEVVGRVVA